MTPECGQCVSVSVATLRTPGPRLAVEADFLTRHGDIIGGHNELSLVITCDDGLTR